MTIGALIFMVMAWTFVLGLTGWAYRRLLTAPPMAERDPEG